MRPDTAATHSRVLIRGLGTLGGARPLYVVDGVILSPESADEVVRALVPDDIESVEVIKGAAAAMLYGQRAEHGVIVITSKDRTAR